MTDVRRRRIFSQDCACRLIPSLIVKKNSARLCGFFYWNVQWLCRSPSWGWYQTCRIPPFLFPKATSGRSISIIEDCNLPAFHIHLWRLEMDKNVIRGETPTQLQTILKRSLTFQCQYQGSHQFFRGQIQCVSDRLVVTHDVHRNVC